MRIKKRIKTLTICEIGSKWSTKSNWIEGKIPNEFRKGYKSDTRRSV